MQLIAKEIDANYDVGTGFHGYAPNKGRISVAEVLRRSGGVDKNTLKESRYSKLQADVLKFVDRQAARLAAHHRSEERAKAKATLTNDGIVNSFAQKFKAAEHRADVLEQDLAAAKALAAEREIECEDLKSELLAARKQIAELQIELSAGKVVNFKRD